MTEACAEALAALKRMWEWSLREKMGGEDRRGAREVFSLHWIRNDAGVPIRCGSLSRLVRVVDVPNRRYRGSDGYWQRLEVGETVPMDSAGTLSALESASSSTPVAPPLKRNLTARDLRRSSRRLEVSNGAGRIGAQAAEATPLGGVTAPSRVHVREERPDPMRGGYFQIAIETDDKRWRQISVPGVDRVGVRVFSLQEARVCDLEPLSGRIRNSASATVLPQPNVATAIAPAQPSYPLSGELDRLNQQLVCDVSAQHGSKLLCVRSNLRFRNSLPVRLRVSFVERRAGAGARSCGGPHIHAPV